MDTEGRLWTEQDGERTIVAETTAEQASFLETLATNATKSIAIDITEAPRKQVNALVKSLRARGLKATEALKLTKDGRKLLHIRSKIGGR